MQRVLAFLLAVAPWSGAALAASPTLELIMSDADWIGAAPQNPWWSDDGTAVYYQQKRPGGDILDVAVYPLDGHAFVHPDSWLDEYRRIFKLMENHLK